MINVAMITYNHGKYISKAIDSILDQNLVYPYSIIIGVDYSDDNTLKICYDYYKKFPNRIYILKANKNIGMYNNLIKTLKVCSDKYIMILEGDDCWINPNKLQKQIDFLEKNPKYGMVYSDVTMIDENDNIIPDTDFLKGIKKKYKSGEIFFDLLQGNFINTPTVCIRRNFINELLIYAQNKEYIYDYWFWLQIALRTKIFYMEEKLANYRRHPTGVSRIPGFLNEKTPKIMIDVLFSFNQLYKKKLSIKEKKILFKVCFHLIRNPKINFFIKWKLFYILSKYLSIY